MNPILSSDESLERKSSQLVRTSPVEGGVILTCILEGDSGGGFLHDESVLDNDVSFRGPLKYVAAFDRRGH